MVKGNLLTKLALAVLWIFQALIILAGIFAFTSTIKIFPWYEPLTMGAFLLIMYLLPLQFIAWIIFMYTYEKALIRKSNRTMSLINLAILVTMLVITIVNEKLFYPFAAVCAVFGTILLIFWIFSIKEFTKA